MEVKAAYNLWAEQYDWNKNRTRDLEALALRKTLADIHFDHCLEIGCGTGKNTAWLISKARKIVAVDLSDSMLALAKQKVRSDKVEFLQADINGQWYFAGHQPFDLATFSLVLEHIENLDHIFGQLSRVLQAGGYVYIGELHPFKQYQGTKARFQTEDGVQTVSCFNHNISDFTNAASKFGFETVALDEFFDDDDRRNVPRILALLLRKKGTRFHP